MFVFAALVLPVAVRPLPALADGTGTRTLAVRPQYLPPNDLCRLLGLESVAGCERLRIGILDAPPRWVEVRRNESANLLLFTGAPGDVEAAAELVTLADVPPRQIEIDVRLLDVNRGMARDVGIDWQAVVRTAGPRTSWGYSENSAESRSQGTNRSEQGVEGEPTHNASVTGSRFRTESGDIRRTFNTSSQLDLGNVIAFLDESGAATIKNAPRILTVNNRRATILDGQRVTYVARYSSYTNLFQTDSLDTGVRLSVVPSLGESGYLTLQVEAELTSLSTDSYIAGSPIKDGQIVENTVVCKSGETVLLGGLTRAREEVSHRRFPILGRILPFLFSKDVRTEQVMESYVLLTPRVVDLQAGIDPRPIEERIVIGREAATPTPASRP
jgi:type II secretory pathway component GspD/PulD (secretin)